MNEMEVLKNDLAIEKEKSAALLFALQSEQEKNAHLEKTLAEMRKKYNAWHQAAESEEEMLVNKLLNKIEEANKGKERLAVQLENEEEFITNRLQQKLMVALAEKEEKDKEIKALQAELKHWRIEQEHMARQVEYEEDAISNSFFKKLREVKAENDELKTRLYSRDSRSSSIDSSAMNVSTVSASSFDHSS